MKKIFHKNFFVVLAIDILIIILSLYFSYLIRFEFSLPRDELVLLKSLIPLILCVKVFFFYFFGLYGGMWRYTSIDHLMNIIKAVLISFLVITFILLFTSKRFIGYSRSVFLIDGCLTILFISGFRIMIRLYFERTSAGTSFKQAFLSIWSFLRRKAKESKNLLIIGAGNCGAKIYKEIKENYYLNYNVIGFLDADSEKIGKRIFGIPVLGNINEVNTVVRNIDVDEAIIAIPSATSIQMKKIIEYCQQSGVIFKTIPGMAELINGKVTVNAIREVSYQDLLGRDVVELDKIKIGSYLNGQSVMVTGAGGSIGSELCRQICRFKPRQIVLYERAESALYDIELELKKNFPTIELVPLLADVKDSDQLRKAFELFRPNTVFHAAAYKHVPLLEIHPWEAIRNNICGTNNLIEVSKEFDVGRFVFVSTDKAVRPTNVMGASKRISEMLIQGQNLCGLSTTRFITVRFGNVVGSVGSVIPLFKKQIKDGGPVTVTHPDMTRYFMTIPEASQLILQAGAMGKGGEIFILKMGTPIKIEDMAIDLIKLSGFEPETEIKIEYIGLRPGEKLCEELVNKDEKVIPTIHKKIMVLKGVECDLTILDGHIGGLIRFAEIQDGNKIKMKLKEIVPDYKPESIKP
jgi:FlaA1/EpsC-like NDP-sugar epimerase